MPQQLWIKCSCCSCYGVTAMMNDLLFYFYAWLSNSNSINSNRKYIKQLQSNTIIIVLLVYLGLPGGRAAASNALTRGCSVRILRTLRLTSRTPSHVKISANNGEGKTSDGCILFIYIGGRHTREPWCQIRLERGGGAAGKCQSTGSFSSWSGT